MAEKMKNLNGKERNFLTLDWFIMEIEDTELFYLKTKFLLATISQKLAICFTSMTGHNNKLCIAAPKSRYASGPDTNISLWKYTVLCCTMFLCIYY